MTRSTRLDKNTVATQIVITQLVNLMDRVNYGKNKKDKFKMTIDVIEYIINNFDKIGHYYDQLKKTAFATFVNCVYNKIQGLLDMGRKALQNGEKVKTSIRKLQYYQRIYENMYSEYEEKRIIETRSQTITTLMEKKQIKSLHNCQEMKKHIKKFLVNYLPLCQDVIEIIKSYCFYDTKTFAQITFIKVLKRNIVNTIDFADQSRKNGFRGDDEGDSDEVEHWSFCIDRENIALQAVNCYWCGNYWAQYAYDWMPDNVLCYCE